MSKALVKYKANVWGISKDRAREILKGYAKRRFDNPGSFKRVEVSGYADNKQIQITGKYNQCFKQELYTN
jgi:hypothetical protein